jgi:sugar-specific transcriptional regulator TrmB
MKKDVIVGVLKSLGYSDKESRVYLANLEQGTVAASVLGIHSGLNRVTTYETLKKLQEKGVVTVSLLKGVKHFSALEPNALLVATENRVEALKQIVPSLSNFAAAARQEHSVQLFEGLTGVKRAYEETLTSKTEILGYANSKNIRQHWKNYDREYVEKRCQSQIFFRGLSTNDAVGRKVQSEDQHYHRQTRLMSHKQMSARKLENEIKIFDDKMLIVSFEPQIFAILMHSATVYETQKQIFEIMWDTMKP